MKRVAGMCGAVAIAVSCIAPMPAAAGDNFAAGLFGGLAAGTLFGIAAASPPPVTTLHRHPHTTFQAATGRGAGRYGMAIEEFGLDRASKCATETDIEI